MVLDREEIIERRDKKVAGYLHYFGIIMAIFYFIIGIVFFVMHVMENLSQNMHYFVGTAFVCYGIFRFYRAIKR